jgi:tRNA 5-methylaminomethyl-2-thiouridine biosynthesis bifunctional protein
MLDETGAIVMEAESVVLACGAELGRFAGFLPLRYSRGQIDWAPVAGEKPQHATSSGGYVAPFGDGVLFGATFDRVTPDAVLAPTEASSEENLATLEALAPELFARIDRTRLKSRAAMRVSAPDVAPICGLLPDAAAWRERYAGLAHGARLDLSAPPPALDGLYVLGALGARGFLLAPLLAEELAAEICGAPAMLDSAARAAIHPARFLERGLKRGSAP